VPVFVRITKHVRSHKTKSLIIKKKRDKISIYHQNAVQQISEEKKKNHARSLGISHKTPSFDVVFENPKALEPFLQEECIGANPCGAIPS